MKMLENKIIYQIYPKSFLDTSGNGFGDIKGIISKLDYIAELGVDYIWLSPICMSPQNDNGYDISDYYTIDPLFGTNEDYENLIKEASKRSMKIMMDLVLNHTSSEHEWFKKALQKDPKYYNYYIFRDKPNEIGSYFGGNAWEYSPEVEKYYFRLFDKTQPDLNWANQEVRQDIYKMVNYWIDKGVAGFRLDVIDLIGKDPDNNIVSKGDNFYIYLKELNNATFNDELLTVGECWGSNLDQSYKMCNKEGLTQAFHFNHLTLIDTDGNKWDKRPINLNELAKCLTLWQNEYTGIEAIVMNNHDTPRLISNWLNDSKYRVESAKLAITLFGLLKGNLYLYQGEEIGATNAYMDEIESYNDVETLNKYNELLEQNLLQEEIMSIIKKTSRDNARVPMQWTNGKNSGFTEGEPWLKINRNYTGINVETDLSSDNSVYKYYQRIIKFRKEHYGEFKSDIEFQVEGNILSFKRGNLKFVANFSQTEINYSKELEVLFSNYNTINNNVLRPYEVFVCNIAF